MGDFVPADEKELAELVTGAAAEAQPLEILGSGSKRALGRPLQLPHSLSTSRLSGIIAYEPNELVLTARAGTPLALIEAALAEDRQMLAFEPGDWGRLLDGGAGEGLSAGQTIGGILSCNLAGPRRPKAGAARDHILGFRAVSGRGEAFKAGGKVVKNVTGYDLAKLMAGSYGTLAVLSEVTVKVLPRPEKTRTVLILGADVGRAVAAMTQALNSPHEVSGAAYLPAPLAAGSAVSYISSAGRPVTALLVEGPGPSVEARCAALRKTLAEFGPCEELHSSNSLALWQALRDAAPLAAAAADAAVWRVSLPPASAPALLHRLGVTERSYFLDWGGGLLWLALDAASDGGAAALREAIGGAGHATLIRGSAALRLAVPVFEPLAPPLAALTARVKDSFDPLRILNPGRMYPSL